MSKLRIHGALCTAHDGEARIRRSAEPRRQERREVLGELQGLDGDLDRRDALGELAAHRRGRAPLLELPILGLLRDEVTDPVGVRRHALLDDLLARRSSPPHRSATILTLPPSLFVSTKSKRWKSENSFNVIRSQPSADSSQPLVSTSTIVSARMPKNVAANANSWMAMFLRSPSAFRSKHSARSSFA